MTTDDILQQHVRTLNLHDRPFYALKRNFVDTIGELVQKTEDQFLDMAGMGQKGADEIKAKLTELGLALKES